MQLDKDRLAYEWNTLPKYIYVTAEGQPWNFEAQIAGGGSPDLPTTLLYDCCSRQFVSPWSYYTTINAAAQVPMDLSEEDVLGPFTLLNQAYNRLIQGFAGTAHSIGDTFFYFQNGVGLDAKEAETLQRMWENKDAFVAAIEQEKAAFRALFERKLDEAKALEQTTPFEAGRYQVVSTNQVYSLETRATLLDMFDRIEVSKDLPLVTTSAFYKVLDGFPYVLEAPTNVNTMFLFHKGNRESWVYNGDPSAPAFEITISKNSRPAVRAPNLTLIKERLNIAVSFTSPEQDTFDFNKYVWADIIMNNGSISSLFAIDERRRTHKAGESLYMFWLRRTGVAFTLSAANVYDPAHKKFLTRMDAKLLDCDKDDINDFKTDLALTLGFYHAHARDIVAEYNKYLTTKITLRKPAAREPRLKDIEPDLYITGYKRACQFVPDIVDETEVSDYEAKGYQVMKYPIEGDPVGLESRYYTCIRDPKHMYPGLRLNNLPNKGKYPLLPCCFTDDQRQKETNYKDYLEGAPIRTSKRPKEARRGFIKTDKTLGAGQYGDPPDKLKTWFTLLVGVDTLVTREGTSRSPASILECILKEELAGKSDQERLARVARERHRLAALSERELQVNSQELWNIGLEKGRQILRDEKAYLDARMFYTLLEYVYKCRLVFLDRENFVPPLYAQTFAHFSSTYPIVIVYENYGGEAEYLTIPQCETFNGLTMVSEQIYDKYMEGFLSYYVNEQGDLQSSVSGASQDPATESVAAQHLNAYGQAVQLDVGRATYQLTYPIAPLTLPVAAQVHSDDAARRLAFVAVRYGDQTVRLTNLTPVLHKKHSWMTDFLDLRRTSQRLMEQARYNASRNRGINLGGGLSKVNEDHWLSSLTVPNPDVRKRVQYATDSFRKYNAAKFAAYKDYTVLPNFYQNTDDFTKRAGQIVSSFRGPTIEWGLTTPALARLPSLTGPFFIELNGKVYHCFRAEAQSTQDINVAVFNTKIIFRVGKPKDDIVRFLFFLTENKTVHTFRAILVART